MAGPVKEKNGLITLLWRLALIIALVKLVSVQFILLSGAFFCYLIYALSKIQHRRITEHNEPRRFKFLDESMWQEQCSDLCIDQEDILSLMFPDSFLVSESLQELVNLIVDQFVSLWFCKVSDDTLFTDSVQLELRHVILNLKTRLARLDVPSFLVFSILPLISRHYADFVAIQQKHGSSYSIESKLRVASVFPAERIHRGVSMLLPGPRVKEKNYFRSTVLKFLPLLLSEKENNNKVILSLLREILSCTVLTNVFEMVSEGDFFNQMIVKLIGDNLQHRDQVKKLRAALEQHTMQMDRKAAPLLAKSLTDVDVKQWLNYIKSIETRDELERIKAQIKNRQSNYSLDSTDLSQLAIIAKAVDSRLASSSDERISLESILSQPKLSAVFREYLRQEKHECDIDMWHDIDLMKAPLEDSDSTQVPLLLEFSNKDDIRHIYQTYFINPALPIRPELCKIVELYVKCSDSNTQKPQLYQEARKALFEIQSDLFIHMQQLHFPQFKKSERFGDVDISIFKQSAHVKREPSMSFSNIKSSSNQAPSNVNNKTVEAVENAFERIMASSSKNLDIQSLFGESNGPHEKDLSFSGFDLSTSEKNRMSTLFENNSDADSEEESIHSDSAELPLDNLELNLNSLEIILAAPGDLSLAEQIRTLDQTLENLAEQDVILSSLLRKAELTNNVGELKVLRRSKLSLEREMKSKEMQKQQFIVQENENSLYGKSRVNIQSCIFGNDESTKYVLYIIEVQKYSSEDPDQIVAGWVVARRFSQFYRLNEYLKKRCPQVSNIKFPKKSVQMLNFQKRQQVESRKPILQNYLHELLQIPEVCSDPAFRSFLSSENFSLGNTNQTNNPKKSLDSVLNKFYGDSGINRRVPSSLAEIVDGSTNKEILENIQEMERELRQFDENEKNATGRVPFVKPISDFLMTVFDLGNSKTWLRGRALLVILQQVLGSTIERTITQQVELNAKLEERVLDVLNLLKSMLFPNGKFRESPQLRTKVEQASTRQEALFVLRVFTNETCSKIFGSRCANQACETFFEMVQNDYLNKNLLFEILDTFLLELFPEVNWESY